MRLNYTILNNICILLLISILFTSCQVLPDDFGHQISDKLNRYFQFYIGLYDTIIML
jgi:hypothetical protein